MTTNMITCSAANGFLQSKTLQERAKLKRKWLQDIPSNWFYLFMKEGVVPFLKRYGYVLSYSDVAQARICKEWAFSHVRIVRESKHYKKTLTYLCTINEDRHEEYEWYRYTIPEDGWAELAKKWAVSEFLDDSDAGSEQCLDLSWFIWHMIHLPSSKQHIYWETNVYEEDENEEGQYADYDPVAYGGDRRTY